MEAQPQPNVNDYLQGLMKAESEGIPIDWKTAALSIASSASGQVVFLQNKISEMTESRANADAAKKDEETVQ